MSSPDVSVLVPVRNAATFLDEALASLCACRKPRLEFLLVDDGSADATPQIIEDWRRRDPRIIPLTMATSGMVAALERARAEARAPLLARLDADDIAYPDRFSLQYDRFQADRDLLLLGTAVDKIDGAGRRIGSIRYPSNDARLKKELPRRNVFVHSTTMMRASAVQRAGGYRRFFFAAEDYDLWLRMAEAGRIENLPDRLGGYRIHPGSTTREHALRQALSAALARTCARRRRQGMPDPASGLEEPLDIEGKAWPEAFDEDVRLYRALAFAEPATLERRRPTPDDIEQLLARGLPPTERRMSQAALINILVGGMLPTPRLRGQAIKALFRAGPLKAARLVWRPRQCR
jgi:hypothetical protein